MRLSAEVKDIAQKALARGWTYEKAGGNNLRFTHPKAGLVTTGAIIGDPRGLINFRAALIRAERAAGLSPNPPPPTPPSDAAGESPGEKVEGEPRGLENAARLLVEDMPAPMVKTPYNWRDELANAVDAAGGNDKVAARIGVSEYTVKGWRRQSDKPPLWHLPALEAATKKHGLAARIRGAMTKEFGKLPETFGERLKFSAPKLAKPAKVAKPAKAAPSVKASPPPPQAATPWQGRPIHLELRDAIKKAGGFRAVAKRINIETPALYLWTRPGKRPPANRWGALEKAVNLPGLAARYTDSRVAQTSAPNLTETLRAAIKFAGGASKVARHFGISADAVFQWTMPDRLPPAARADELEKLLSIPGLAKRLRDAWKTRLDTRGGKAIAPPPDVSKLSARLQEALMDAGRVAAKIMVLIKEVEAMGKKL